MDILCLQDLLSAFGSDVEEERRGRIHHLRHDMYTHTHKINRGLIIYIEYNRKPRIMENKIKIKAKINISRARFCWSRYGENGHQGGR
jgi:hypothetical protein